MALVYLLTWMETGVGRRAEEFDSEAEWQEAALRLRAAGAIGLRLFEGTSVPVEVQVKRGS